MTGTNESAELETRIQEIFHTALDVQAEERARILDTLCDGDSTLIEEVLSLLDACEAEQMLSSRASRETRSRSAALPKSRWIGPYELDRLLGRGGMGAVYLANRVDGQFRQQVAIKLIDMPLATEMFRDRFRQERQILAGLVHSYIARLLDGGLSSDGEPYLVMEYVQGVSLIRFCDEHKLSMEQRLQLFQNVCRAVQFAYQNLVVHRDPKPDNILVIEDGTPRLLDFGTAKLLATVEDHSPAEWTRQGFHAFTPQYASPEQVLGSLITTASDIYSLGVLLYQLVTGVRPYELKEQTTAEMLRLICNEQPAKPSSRTILGKIDPDIDAIVMKALRKEPGERYATVDLLATDVECFLEGRPVLAQRGSMRYLAGKFVRRHRTLLIAACVLCATLLAGMAGVLWQSREANLRRQEAEERSADLRELSNSLLTELDVALKDIPGTTGAQKLLVTRVLEHLDHMAKTRGDRQTELDLIAAYTRLGNVQGNVYEHNLADSAGALASFDKALALTRPLLAANPNDKGALLALARTTEDRSETLSQPGRTEESVTALRIGAQTFERLIALPGATPALFQEASAATETLGDELSNDEGLADAAAGMVAFRRSLALDEQALQLDPTYLLARRGLAYMHLHIGNIELDDDAPHAIEEFQTALLILDALPGKERTKLNAVNLRATVVRKEAAAFMEMGDYAHAVPLFEESMAVIRRLHDADRQDAHPLGDMKRISDVEASCFEYAADPRLATMPGERRQNLQRTAQLLGQEAGAIQDLLKIDDTGAELKPELASVQVRLGSIRKTLHQPGNWEAVSRTALAVLKQAASLQHASVENIDLATAAFLTAEPSSLRDPSLAVQFAERGVAMTHRRNASLLLQLAQAYRASGQPLKARTAAEEGLSQLPDSPPGSPKVRIRKLLEFEIPAIAH